MKTTPSLRFRNEPYWRVTVAALASILACTFGLVAAPAQAAVKPAAVYFGLGDSYAAGTGGGSATQTPGLPAECLQTSGAYPTLLGGTNLGCFGATVETVAAIADTYAMALGSATDITLTVGGNDVGTGQVAVLCVPAPASAECFNAVAATEAALPGLPGKISSLIAHVRSVAAGADVIVTGYPRLFTVTSTMTPEERTLATKLNELANKLNDAIKVGATAVGAPFVDVTARFLGHGIGSPTPWITYDGNLLNPANFHPNAAGYANGYTPAVRSALKVAAGN